MLSKNQDRICYFFPWAIPVQDGIILNKDGSLQTTVKFRAADLDSSTKNEQIQNTLRINNAIKRIGGNWSIHCESRRIQVKEYDKSTEKNMSIPIQIIENEREKNFMSGQHYDSKYYLTFTYMMPSEYTKKFFDYFVEKNNGSALRSTRNKSSRNSKNYIEDNLKYFRAQVQNIAGLLEEIFKDLKFLNTQETITYLHSCISDNDFNLKVPQEDVLIDGYISDCDVVTGLEPMLGSKYLRAISIYSFPTASIPNILDNLNRLNIEYRWVTRFIFMDKIKALKEMDTYHKKWFAGRKSLKQLVKEIVTKEETVNTDISAENKADEIIEEKEIIQNDLASLGYYTCSIILLDEDSVEMEKKVELVKKSINSLGFVAQNETFNIIEAWLGSIPGNTACNVRRPLLNSITLTHLLPFSAVWAGTDKNKHLNAASLLYTKTDGYTPFRLNLHYGDVGHTFMVGPTGAGKSVHLGMLAAQFMKYKNAQVFTFDKGGSMRVLCQAIGGAFYDLGNLGISFQVLANVDNEAEKAWAQEWLEDIFGQENIKLNPANKKNILNALNSLSAVSKDKRTLINFSSFLQDVELRTALNPYVRGNYAKYFDANQDNLDRSKFQVFEMERLMETKNAVMPVLNYLFHKLETEKLDGSPTLFILDECWVFLDNPKFENKIREWLKVLRKKNASVVFATQSLSDIIDSNIISAILDACYTRIYLPNANANEDYSKESYKKFGLNEREIEIISQALPKKQYYYKSPKGSRLYELNLSKTELAYVGSSSSEDQKMCRELGKLSNEDFNKEWGKYKKSSVMLH